MATSITHRVTGAYLAIGALALVYWVTAAAAGPGAFATAQWAAASGLGQALLILWVYAFFFHLCNGIRHLYWDTGRGLRIDTAYANGWAAIGAATALWLLTLGIAYGVMGGAG
jgi:succinate dehydrogenase / fumarate reductase cytochrome b subunit